MNKKRSSKSQKGGYSSVGGLSGAERESMRQFNYYGRTRLENLDEHDVAGLEREIEFILRNSNIANSPLRHTNIDNAASDYDSNNIVNINGS